MSNAKKEYWKNIFIWRKLKAIEYKGGECKKCGCNKYHCLEFHHRNKKKKEFQWNELRRCSKATVIKELDKCDLLCSNCHKEEHCDPNILDRVFAWRAKIDKKKVKPKLCVHCNTKFKPKLEKTKFCSRECVSLHQRRIEWPKNLKKMVLNSSCRSVAAKLGVSDKAVAKRLKRIK